MGTSATTTTSAAHMTVRRHTRWSTLVAVTTTATTGAARALCGQFRFVRHETIIDDLF